MADGMEFWIRTSEPEANEYDSTKFDFGNINSISVSLSPEVDQKAVVIYGFDRALCIDKGVSKSYTVSFTRVNPMEPDNRDSSDTRNWSNAKWLKAIQTVLNRWQARTNGFILHAKSQFPDCFPTIDNVNVFVSSITLPKNNRSSQAVSGTVSFKVGTLKLSDKPIVPEYTITYKPQDSALNEFYDKASEGVVVTVAYPPKKWVEYKMGQELAFMGWATASGSISVAYRPGQTLTMERNMNLYAIWRESIKPKAYTMNGSFTHTVGADVHRIIVYCFGAGGAGTGIFGIHDTDYPIQNGRGGGGGGGALQIVERIVNPGDSITGYIGKGGIVNTRMDPNDPVDNGEASYVEIKGTRYEAGGGYGAWTYHGGSGGYADNGVTGHYGGNFMEDGQGRFGGTKGYSILRPGSGQLYIEGGGGGGSVPTENVSSSALYLMEEICKGGDGGGAGIPYGEINSTPGKGGCGGGGGYVERMGNNQIQTGKGSSGGDGFVIVEEFYD